MGQVQICSITQAMGRILKPGIETEQPLTIWDSHFQVWSLRIHTDYNLDDKLQKNPHNIFNSDVLLAIMKWCFQPFASDEHFLVSHDEIA